MSGLFLLRKIKRVVAFHGTTLYLLGGCMEKLTWKEKMLCECISVLTACWIVILFFLIYKFINYLWIAGIVITVFIIVAETRRNYEGYKE